MRLAAVLVGFNLFFARFLCWLGLLPLLVEIWFSWGNDLVFL